VPGLRREAGQASCGGVRPAGEARGAASNKQLSKSTQASAGRQARGALEEETREQRADPSNLQALHLRPSIENLLLVNFLRD
jgi:hypothetical protein